MMNRWQDKSGFTLIEVVLVIIIMGILGGIATMKFMSTSEAARHQATQAELDALAAAIVGDPGGYASGARSDFGYVGDVGSLPPDLNALVANPGYATWHGPYIKGDFAADDYAKDAWNGSYVYIDTLLRSTGSGSSIDKIFAPSRAALLSNMVSGVLYDADQEIPGVSHKDSLTVALIYPDGSGGLTTATAALGSGGDFSFTGVPIGNHILRVIYKPESDTITVSVCVTPGSRVKIDIVFPADLW